MCGEAVSPASGNHGNSFHLQLHIPQNKLVIRFFIGGKPLGDI